MVIDTSSSRSRHKSRTITRSLLRTLVCTTLLAGTSTAALAGEFSIAPEFEVGVRYDSNPRYQTSSQEINSARGTLFDISLPIQYLTPISSISLNPRVVRSFYSKEEDADLEDRDAYLTGVASRSFRQSNLGASFGYTDLSLRTSEFEDPGDSLPDPPSGGGIVRNNEDTQKSLYFQPNWQYQISRTNVFRLNGGYREIKYDEELLSRRFDYSFSNATAAFQHIINVRHSIELQTNLSKYDAENIDIRIANVSTSNGLSMVYTYSLSERATLSVNVGFARTKSTVKRPNSIDPGTGEPICNPDFIVFFPCEAKSDSTNFVGNLTATRNSETTRYRFVIGQSITPNSNGSQVLRFNIEANADKRISERFSTRFGIVAYTQENVGASEFDFSRDYIRGNLRLSYSLTRKWSLYGTYSYTLNKQDSFLNDNLDSDNNFVSMGIRFNGDGWRW